MANDNEAFKERVNESLVRHVNAVNEVVKRKNTYFWDYGNSFMLNAGRAGADIFAEDGVAFDIPVTWRISWVMFFLSDSDLPMDLHVRKGGRSRFDRFLG